MKTFRLVVAVVVALSCCSAAAQVAGSSDGIVEQFHTVRLTRGSELSLVVSKSSGATPTIAVLLFPGYPGILKINYGIAGISYDLSGNFLIRARRFLNTDKIFTVMVDCPVDEWQACGDDYRTSTRHAADITDVINAVNTNFGSRQVYLLGTSYGTLSTSFLARSLTDRIAGAIHTSTITNPPSGRNAHGVPLGNFDWSLTTTPQLFVHHHDDPCETSPYSGIVERKAEIPLITVEGSRGARGDACKARTAHGFVGRERGVMKAIADWITDRKLDPVVNN